MSGRLILEFDEFKNRDSSNRTKRISDEEFLRLLRENCKNFSFDNDLLWRCTNRNFGDFGIWFESERKQTIGTYKYKKFFDDRNGYPVPRYKSLIGSSEKEGAIYFGSESSSKDDDNLFLLIPFDNSQIVFAGVPDLAIWSHGNDSIQEFTDDLFIMKNYESGFKVPKEELFDILSKTPALKWIDILTKRNLGFEFFTSSTSLLLHHSKVDWLIENIS